MTDAQNRQRWSIDQQRKARAAFAAQQESADTVRARRLAELRKMAEMMADMPHMAKTLARVQAEIATMTTGKSSDAAHKTSA